MADENTIMDGRSFRLSVVTPYEVFYDGDCVMSIIPSADGELGVMAGHSPLVTALYPGELRIQTETAWLYAFVSNGYVQIERDFMIVVCNAAEWDKDIQADRANHAWQRAEQRLKEPDLSEDVRKRAVHAVRRAKMRLHCYERYQKRLEEHQS